jgi:endonuclease-3
MPAARAKAADRASTRRLLDALKKIHPNADCELRFKNPWQLVVATILSAQCTDQRVNAVTPGLFRRYPNPASLAGADPAELEALIRPTGFFRSKARSLQGCARTVVERYGGKVPRTLDQLVTLAGVGRKTANVVLGHAFGLAEGVAVDTHVLRVSNRLGLSRSQDPLVIEQELMALVPRERWTETTDLLIFHGRRVCHARRPACGECALFPRCPWPDKQAWAQAPPAGRRAAGRNSSRSRD